MAYREKMKVDTIMQDYQPPEVRELTQNTVISFPTKSVPTFTHVIVHTGDPEVFDRRLLWLRQGGLPNPGGTFWTSRHEGNNAFNSKI